MGQRNTEPYRRSFSGSVGAGVGALMGGSHRQYYILEYRSSSKYHHTGETQKIIVDQVELGRDPRCQIRFDDSFTSVSRRHAAIVRDGSAWKLVHLSKTNPTLLNGRPVADEWYLQNGDEIQLSSNGPRLGFIIPQGDKSMIKNINFTERFSLFRQQALRPYKQMVAWGSVLFLLVIAGLVSWGVISHRQYTETSYNQGKIIADYGDSLDSVDVKIKEAEEKAKEAEEKAKEAEEKAKKAHHKATDASKQAENAIDIATAANDNTTHIATTTSSSSSTATATAPAHEGSLASQPVASSGFSSGMTTQESCFPYIYYIQLDKIEWTHKNGHVEQFDIIRRWAGTGFMLEDGRFVTSLRIIEQWLFQVNGNLLNEELHPLNKAVCNNERVVAYFTAHSSNGSSLTFTSEDFVVDRSADNLTVLRGPLGGLVRGARILIAPETGGKDWAYMQTSQRSGLKFNPDKSRLMGRAVDLTILGFPGQVGISSASGPIYGSAKTAGSGLNRGDILTTNTSFEVGGSGAPVFAISENGEYEVVGVVSNVTEGMRGIVVPISSVR